MNEEEDERFSRIINSLQNKLNDALKRTHKAEAEVDEVRAKLIQRTDRVNKLNRTAADMEDWAIRAEAERDNERIAKKIAADAADRFRDVLSECLDYDKNPGDDILVVEVRQMFGKNGPEPTRWREFCAGALAKVDQINADRKKGTDE